MPPRSVHRITCAECRPIEWLKLASVNKIKDLAHDRMVSFSGRISALTQGCVHRVHRTQTQQHSVTEPCAKVIRLESHSDLLARTYEALNCCCAKEIIEPYFAGRNFML